MLCHQAPQHLPLAQPSCHTPILSLKVTRSSPAAAVFEHLHQSTIFLSFLQMQTKLFVCTSTSLAIQFVSSSNTLKLIFTAWMIKVLILTASQGVTPHVSVETIVALPCDAWQSGVLGASVQRSIEDR